MTSYTFSTWRPRRLYTTSGYVFDYVTLIRRSTSISKTNFVEDLNQLLRYITISGLKKQTSTILEFFSLRFWPDRSNFLAFLDLCLKFRWNRGTRGGVITSYTIVRWDGGRGGSILLPISYLMTSLSSEGQHLSANQIQSTYLNPRLRYNYFRFGKTTVRRIEILLSVSILTILPYSACHSALGCRTSSKSVHSQLRYDVISIFKMAAAAAQFCIALSRISVSIS